MDVAPSNKPSLTETHRLIENPDGEAGFNPFLEWPPSNENMVFMVFKYVVVGILIVPLRIIFSLLLLVTLVLLFKIATLGLDENDLDTPLPPNRRLWLYPVELISRALFFWWGFVWIETKGTKVNDSTQAPIIVSNHVSWIDPMLLASQYITTVISARENLQFPFLSAMMLATKAITIDRDDPNSRNIAKMAIEKRAKQAYQDSNWFQLLIFPEGTCTNGHCLISFKPGAFVPGVPIQPVCLKYPYEHCNLAWTEEWQGGTIIHRFVKMMFQFVNWVEIEYLPVYIPSEDEKADPNLYANNVRTYMASRMNVKMTEHSYDDVRLLILAQKLKKSLGVQMIDGILINDLHKLYNMDYGEAQDLLRKFAQQDTGNSNTLNYTQFCQFLELPDCPELEQVFEQFDVAGNGYIDFKQLLVGTQVLSKKCRTEDIVKNTFRLFDLDQNGTIEYHEFKSAMQALYPLMTATTIDEHWKVMGHKVGDSITYEQFCAFAKKNPVQIHSHHERFIHVPVDSIKITVDLDD